METQFKIYIPLYGQFQDLKQKTYALSGLQTIDDRIN